MKNVDTVKRNTLKKKIIVVICIAIILALIVIGTITKNKVQKNEEIKIEKEAEENNDVYYKIIDNTDNNNIKGLIIANYNEGISKIEYPNPRDINNEIVLNCNGKTKVVIDYKTEFEKEYNVKVTTTLGETINKKINVNDELVDQHINISKKEDANNEYDFAHIDFIEEENATKYYKIGENITDWIQYQGDIDISYIDYCLNDEKNEVIVYAKEINSYGNTIINKKVLKDINKKRKLDVFNYMKMHKETLDEWGFSLVSNNNCEGVYFSIGEVGAYHSTHDGWYSASFEINFNKMKNLLPEKTILKHTGRYVSFETITNYDDGSSINNPNSYVEIDSSVAINNIIFNISGWDPWGDWSYGKLYSVILEGIPADLNITSVL